VFQGSWALSELVAELNVGTPIEKLERYWVFLFFSCFCVFDGGIPILGPLFEGKS
jgi:hypothetical protein